MDKASVGRCFKGMQRHGLIGLACDTQDGRLRHASFMAQERCALPAAQSARQTGLEAGQKWRRPLRRKAAPARPPDNPGP